MPKLVEWVLNITQARYDAHLAGEPPTPTASRRRMS